MKKVVFTDLDNTLYNWVDYFAPSFRGMLHAIARVTGESESDLVNDFRRVYQECNDMEFAPSVQRLSVCEGKSEDYVKNLVRIAKGTFSRVRQKRLEPYPDIKKTLAWIRDQGISIIAVSNAPMGHAYRRLCRLRLHKYMDGIAAREDNSSDFDGFVPIEVRAKIASGYFIPQMRHWYLCLSELKPSPDGYARIINDLGVSAEDVLVVGDSLQRDVMPAIKLGAMGVWAEYGTKVEKKNLETVYILGDWDNKRITEINQDVKIEASAKILKFSDLMQILPPRQPTLWSCIEEGSDVLTVLPGIDLHISNSHQFLSTNRASEEINVSTAEKEKTQQLSLWEIT